MSRNHTYTDTSKLRQLNTWRSPTTKAQRRIRRKSLMKQRLKPGLHSVRRTYATEMRKRIYASHARRGVYTPRVDLGAYTQTSTQYRLSTIPRRWIYFISRVEACVLSSSPDPIHFVLLYILRYYCCTRVFILYIRVCIPVLLVMSSIVYNLHHIMSSTLSFYFLRSSYRPAQSRNMGVFVIFVILIMSFNVFVSAISTPTSWLVLVLI